MPSTTFDALTAARDLQSAGVEHSQAKAVAALENPPREMGDRARARDRWTHCGRGVLAGVRLMLGTGA